MLDAEDHNTCMSVSTSVTDHHEYHKFKCNACRTGPSKATAFNNHGLGYVSVGIPDAIAPHAWAGRTYVCGSTELCKCVRLRNTRTMEFINYVSSMIFRQTSNEGSF